MVQYFAENLDGFAVTQNGWVQSYGSRATRPSILWGDVSRPAPITVRWSTFTQSLTEKPVKGMLTGPVTILAWSFVRDDQPLGETANQVALALRDEIADLEAAGIGIIQVDEPALRELLPLKKRDQPAYLDWSVGSFRLATVGRRGHDADPHPPLLLGVRRRDRRDRPPRRRRHLDRGGPVARWRSCPSIERSGFGRGIGPGVYDIHSPRVPSVDEVQRAARDRARVDPGAPGLGQPGLRTQDPRLRRDGRVAREHARGDARGARRARRLTRSAQARWGVRSGGRPTLASCSWRSTRPVRAIAPRSSSTASCPIIARLAPRQRRAGRATASA